MQAYVRMAVTQGADNFDGDPAVGEIKKCHCASEKYAGQ